MVGSAGLAVAAIVVFVVGYIFGWAAGRASGKVEAYERQVHGNWLDGEDVGGDH